MWIMFAIVAAASITAFADPRVEGSNTNTPAREQSLDGEWRIATDPNDAGKAGSWFEAGKFPATDSRPIQVPGNIWESWPQYNGLVWYARTFTPAMRKSDDMRYYLRFGAVQYSCDVWLNGQHLGAHEGAASPFELDATRDLRQGENYVALRVFSPRAQNGVDPFVYNPGGLLQHVTLSAHPKLRVTDVFIRPDWKTGKAPLTITLENNTGSAADVTLSLTYGEHKSGRRLGKASTKVSVPPGESVRDMLVTVKRPRLWSLEDPFLYTVRVVAACNGQQDEYTVPHVGFRDLRINKYGYFELNGKRIFPKSTHANVSDPVCVQGTPRDMKRVQPNLADLKSAGFNMFREIAYSALPEQLDIADELRMLIYNEHQGSWFLNNPAKFALDLPEVIKRDRNRPSLVVWGLLNEIYAGQVYEAAKAYLPTLRKMDNTRLVFLNSGRFDQDYAGAGSAANPGSSTWDVHIRDGHLYNGFPTSWNYAMDIAAYTEPVFVSEAGMGSSYNALGEKRKLQQSGAPKDAPGYAWINPMAEHYEKVWAKYDLRAIYPSIQDMITDSQKLSARERTFLMSIFRSSPKVIGYNVTGHADYWGYAEGVTDTWGEFKAGHLEVLREGWAKLKWCLFVNPMNVYADRPFRVKVALANEDVLAAGSYPARLSISGPSGEVWHKDVAVVVQGGENPPLAYTVLDEDVTLTGLAEGKYTLEAKPSRSPRASSSRLEFMVTEKSKHPDLSGTIVTAVGVSQAVRDLIVSRGAVLRDFAAGETFDNEVVVVGDGPIGDAAAWRALYRRIAGGAHAVFLSRGAFRTGADVSQGDGVPNKWLAASTKGTQKRASEWLYHSDFIAKNHPVMRGLPTGTMTPDCYGQLLCAGAYFGATVPDETVVARVYCASGPAVWDGLMLGTYRHHAGKFTVNAFDLVESMGNPAGDRMIVNLVAYAASDAAKAQPLPADYDAELDSLGIRDDVSITPAAK